MASQASVGNTGRQRAVVCAVPVARRVEGHCKAVYGACVPGIVMGVAVGASMVGERGGWWGILIVDATTGIVLDLGRFASGGLRLNENRTWLFTFWAVLLFWKY